MNGRGRGRERDSPDDELLLDMVVDDEVEVPLSVARLLVLQPKVQVREHVQARSQQRHRLRHNAQLPLLGLACRKTLYIYISFHPHWTNG